MLNERKRMDTEKLRTLLLVIENKNITEAAQKSGFTPVGHKSHDRIA
jgi:DNA-binding transcriptional LysR family regulator